MIRLDWRFTSAVALLTGALVILFARWTAASWWGFPAFLAAVSIFCLLPGAALLPRHDGLDPLERASLRLVLGMTATLALYGLLRRAGLAGAFWLWPVCSLVIIGHRSRPLAWPTIRIDGRVPPACWALLGIVVLQLALLSYIPGYFRNFVRYADGTMSFDIHSADSLLHTALARELTHSIPPGAPFLSGATVVYHFGMDLMAAMTASIASLSVLDATVRFVPTFFAILVPLSIYAFSARWLRSPAAGVLVAFLVMFAEDLSYIPGLLLSPPGPWATVFFAMTTTLSLYFLNPVLPALGVLFSAWLCLAQYHETSRAVWLWYAGLLLGLLTDYKVFTAMHAALALGVTGLVYAARWRDFSMIKAATVAAVCLTPLAVHQWLTSRATAVEWIYGPWPYVQEMYRMFGWTAPGTAMVLLIGLPLYLSLTFGPRLLGIADVLRALVRMDRGAPLRYMLAVMIVSGPAVSLLTRVVERGYPLAEQYNNAAWFLALSKHVMWLFAVEAIWRWGAQRSVAVVRAAAFALVLLSLPSTVQLWRWIGSLPLARIAQPELAAIDWLDRECAAGDVVFAREEFAARVVTLTRCHVTFGRAFRPLMRREALHARVDDVEQFWSAWQHGTVRFDILDRYGTRFIVAGARWKDPIDDAARPPDSGRLRIRHRSDDLIVLELTPAATTSIRTRARDSGE